MAVFVVVKDFHISEYYRIQHHRDIIILLAYSQCARGKILHKHAQRNGVRMNTLTL